MRKLAAIMFTDIVGYSAVMSKDESAAMKVLARNRVIQQAAVSQHNGEFIKEIGDGTLCIFNSPWDALSCAISIQKQVMDAADLTLRIGIHTGDIVVADKDVFGDGVNIASRIQALCEPGCIYISGKVYDEIRNKAGIRADCIGEKILKNIDHPVVIYTISSDCVRDWEEKVPEVVLGETIPVRPFSIYIWQKPVMKMVMLLAVIFLVFGIGFLLLRPVFLQAAIESDPVPIAVISFENQTGDENLDYLQKAIPNLIITNLEQSGLFRVMTWERMQDLLVQIGKKDQETIDAETGFSLCHKEGCKLIVVGSYVKAGEVFATDVKVLDVESKRILNSVSSRGKGLESILKSQIDDLSKAIAKTAGISEIKTEKAGMQIIDVTTNSMEAYEYYIRGNEARDLMKYDSAITLLNEAIRIDSAFAMAYFSLASVYDRLEDITMKDENLIKAHRFSERSTEKERLYITAYYMSVIQRRFDEYLRIMKEMESKYPREKKVHNSLGDYYFAFAYLPKSDMTNAINAYKKAIELDPDYGVAIKSLADVYAVQGDFEKAIANYQKYSELNPEDVTIFESMADLYFIWGRIDDAINEFSKALEYKKDLHSSAFGLSYLYLLKENYTDAFRWADDALIMAPSESIRNSLFLYKAFLEFWCGNITKGNIILDKLRSKADPDLSQTLDLFMADLCFTAGDLENSKLFFRETWKLNKCSSADSAHWALSMANHYFWSGMVDLKEGRIDSAKIKAESIKAINPQKIILASGNIPYFNYDYLYFEVASAESDSLKALEIINGIRKNEVIPAIGDFPFFDLIIYTNKPYLIDCLARAYVEWGKTDKAIKEYERLITFDPSAKDRHLVYPVYHYQLGLLYEKKGLTVQAIEQYRKFLEIWKNADHSFPQPKDAKNRLEKLLTVR